MCAVGATALLTGCDSGQPAGDGARGSIEISGRSSKLAACRWSRDSDWLELTSEAEQTLRLARFVSFDAGTSGPWPVTLTEGAAPLAFSCSGPRSFTHTDNGVFGSASLECTSTAARMTLKFSYAGCSPAAAG